MKAEKKITEVKPNLKKLTYIKTETENNYEIDFFKWTKTQVKLLKKKEFSKLDLENLIEEIESLGRSEKRTLKSYLENLLLHKLKVQFQPKKHSVSWDLSIKEANHKAQTTLQENPSLKSKLINIVEDAYFSARLRAALETKLEENIFPEKCPWSLKDLFPNLEAKYCSHELR